MKKNYLFTFILTLCFGFLSFGQTVLITGYVDAPCTGAKPRTVEIYVSGTIDFTDWKLQRQSNGKGYTTNIDLTNLGTITDAFAYITNDSAGFTSEFNVTTNILQNSAISSNGNDAFQISDKDDNLIDRFGEDGVDGTGKDWEHEDTYYYRKDGSTANAGTFSSSNWTFGAKNLLDGKGKCNSAAALSTLVPFGSFKLVASTDPSITVGNAVTGLDYFEGNGPSAEKDFTVEGSNLTTDITVTAPTNFEVSTTSDSGFAASVTLTQSSGSVASTTIYTRLKAGLTTNTYTGDVTVSSTGATDKTVALSGKISPADPQFSFRAFLDDFNTIISTGNPSEEQTFTVEGLFLSNNLVVTAPANYEVSLTTGTGFSAAVNIVPNSGTIAKTTVFVRLKSGLAAGKYAGDITLSSTGVADQTIAVSGNAFGAVTNSMVITGVYDGSLSGGTPKGVELYVLKDIADLSLYGLSAVANGGGTSAGTIRYSFPADAVTAGTFIYVATEDTNFNTFFGMMPTYTTGSVSINGDDSIELYESGQIVDVFGDVNKDGSGEAWDYLDGWAYRKANTGPEGTTFTVANWTYSGVDGLEGGTNNATATKAFPLGTYKNTTASVQRNGILGFATYPNPITNNEFTITSSNSSKKEVAIFNVLGKNVYSTSFTGTKATLDVSSISSGIYVLKVTEESKTATKKLVIR
ncbi:T9SS type A sorting domain-containing protein [Polaribacter cellanae]|uniref:T9SS type A sorting domain-containing protein n=1 Tax=Polaribacter cellanae TaxID=2818493 RepID=A0A975H5K6_9FLAO|nr:T9SS type A sorting domain-containing protein [Polaribacter cellanae]QTE21511.1 T9SS type A sorting domain-containing protein [Polaribacter cellanae]